MERRKSIVFLYTAIVCGVALFFLSFKSFDKGSANPPLKDVLSDSIARIVSACPGEIGVAVIINNTDTIRVNDKSVYPLMSVFKVHQALALCEDFDNKDISLDTIIKVNRNELDPKTWSPMLKVRNCHITDRERLAVLYACPERQQRKQSDV